MTTILVIYLLCNLPAFTLQSSCSWSSWSSEPTCQWVGYHCMKGYHRHCLCDNVISMGSACGYNEEILQNYVETKPFVSNFKSAEGFCSKQDCIKFKNWCSWESWSYWFPVTNTTCERRRSRQCCDSQPKRGYTIDLSKNYGCFVSKSEMNLTDVQVVFKEMQCSRYTKWYKIGIYASIGIGVLLIFIIICGLTRSSMDKIRTLSAVEQISCDEIVNPISPTAPIDELSFEQPVVVVEAIKEPFVSTPGLPNTPPSYDETIGFQNVSEPVKFTPAPIIEKPMEDDSKTIVQENSSETNTSRPNTENIPPPSYALFVRNPNLFNQGN